jgi:oxalate decarboxylase/phosphoglucose isomerase-like protein (cupin superfamily)
VLGGRSWFVTEEGEVGLDPMGALLIPRGVHHGIDNRGTDPLIVLSSMSPPDDVAVSAPVVARLEALRTGDERPGPLSRAFGRLLGGDR